MSWRKTNTTVEKMDDVSYAGHSRPLVSPSADGDQRASSSGNPWVPASAGSTGNRAVTRGEDGVALILVLLAMLVMSALAATIVYTARAETFASGNYKLETEADYLAKAGIQKAVNWFRSNHYQAIQPAQAPTYYAVTTTGAPYYLYTANNSPVQCVSGCSTLNSTVQLIGYGSGSTNFPNISNTASPSTTVAAAFNSDLGNFSVTDASGNQLGTFSVRATLMNYQTVGRGTQPPYTIVPIDTWMITSLSKYTGGQGITLASAEEAAIVQPIYVPNLSSALYGFCSVTMSGSAGVCTDSFNSALGAYGGGNNNTAAAGCNGNSARNIIDTGANVGANGGVTLGSNVTVSGNVVIGTGAPTTCPTGYSGSTSSVLGEVINGPYKAPPPAPTFPTGFPGTAPSFAVNQNNSPQVFPLGTGSTCNGSAANPFEIGSLSINGSSPVVEFVGSQDPANPIYYDIDSLSEQTGDIYVSGYVVLNIQSGLSITGNGTSNGISGDIPPEYLVINYAGTSTASIGGNGAISAVLNAPNAEVDLGGGGHLGYFVGAIQANSVNDMGGYPVHYDLQLGRMGGTMGAPTTTAYSRQKM
ncbi:MAG: hypothetical protein DMG21_05415 [Acidobacteria bacterium]|nr:MAG: hypothetical protein DMG21_05415 [Acidobacteriota bacterium]